MHNFLWQQWRGFIYLLCIIITFVAWSVGFWYDWPEYRHACIGFISNKLYKAQNLNNVLNSFLKCAIGNVFSDFSIIWRSFETKSKCLLPTGVSPGTFLVVSVHVFFLPCDSLTGDDIVSPLTMICGREGSSSSRQGVRHTDSEVSLITQWLGRKRSGQ